MVHGNPSPCNDPEVKRSKVKVTRLLDELQSWVCTGASIPMEQGGHVPPMTCRSPQYFEGGNIHGNVPPNILEVMSLRMSTRVTATVVCCILMQTLCVVSQKASASGGLRPPDPLPGLRPWIPLGDFRPQDPQSSFMSSRMILRYRRPWVCRSTRLLRFL